MLSRPEGRRLTVKQFLLAAPGPAAVFLAVSLLLISKNLPFWAYLLSRPGIRWDYLGLTLWTVCQGFWIFLALWGTGRFILDFAPAGKRDFRGSQALAFGLGLALTGHLLFFLGLLHRLRPAFAWGLLILQSLAAVRGLCSLRRRAAPAGAGPPVPITWLLASLMACCLWAAWHLLASALAPPSDWDSLAYHLPIAKAWAKTGAIASMPWMLQAHWPSAMELLYAWTMLLGDHRLSQILHVLCGLAAAWLLWAAAGELEARRDNSPPAEGVRKTQWCAAALWLTLPVFTLYAPTAHSDLALSLMVLSSLFCLLKFWSAPGPDDYFWPALAGCFAGFGAGFKYHGLFWAAASLAAIPLRRWPVFLCAFAAAACPWYLKSWILTGNPVWPFAYRLFGGADWNPAAAEAYRSASQLYWNPADTAAWLLRLFTDFGPPHYSGFFALPAVLTIALGPPLAGPAGRISFAVLLYLIPMVMPYGSWRHMLPVLPWICFLCARSAARLIDIQPRRFPWLFALLSFALIPSLRLTQNNELFAVSALRSRQNPGSAPEAAYLSRKLDHYVFAGKLNDAVDPAAKILLFREIRGYYLKPDYIWGDPLNQGVLDYQSCSTPEFLLKRLQELGVSHIWINPGLKIYQPQSGYYRPGIIALMDSFLNRHAKLVLKLEGGELHQILFKGHAAR